MSPASSAGSVCQPPSLGCSSTLQNTPSAIWVKPSIRRSGSGASADRSVDVNRHVHYFKGEPFRWQREDRIRGQALPRLEGRVRHRVVEVKEELVGTAADGWHLTKREAQTHGFLEINAFGFHGLVFQQPNETAAASVRPQIVAQQMAEFNTRTKRDLALPDPLND